MTVNHDEITSDRPGILLARMKINPPSTIAEADLHVARLLAQRSRQAKRLVKAHTIHKSNPDQQMLPRWDRVLRLDRKLRDRFRDDLDRCIGAVSAMCAGAAVASRQDALDVVEHTVRAWPDETKINGTVLRLLGEIIRDARDDGAVLRAWTLLRQYAGDGDESLRALVEQRGIALAHLFERVRDGAVRAGDRELALGLNQQLLERCERSAIDPMTERAWLAQLEIFRATGRTVAGRAFCERITRRCREANREDLLDRVAEWESRLRGPREPALLLRVRAVERKLEIEASGTGGAALKERPRQRALLVLAFAYPSGLSLEDAAHMLDLMWRHASPRWPGPGSKLSLAPLPASLVELAERMGVARDRKVREATENLVTDTVSTCMAGVGAPLVRLADCRIERDDPDDLVRLELGMVVGWKVCQPSDVAAALRALGVMPLADLGRGLPDQRPRGPGRPRTIQSSMKRMRLADLDHDAHSDDMSGVRPDPRAASG